MPLFARLGPKFTKHLLVNESGEREKRERERERERERASKREERERLGVDLYDMLYDIMIYALDQRALAAGFTPDIYISLFPTFQFIHKVNTYLLNEFSKYSVLFKHIFSNFLLVFQLLLRA